MSTTESRVKRVLELRVDSALVQHLDTLASVFADGSGVGGHIALPSAAGLRADIDKRALQVAQALALSDPSGISRAPHEQPFQRPRDEV